MAQPLCQWPRPLWYIGGMDQIVPEADDDPREAIARLEERIELLAARIENCRKFILASRIAIALGGVVLAALMLGAIVFDPTAMLGSIAAVLCGFVLLGSNSSTAREAADRMAAAEAERAALIGRIELRVVDSPPTWH